MVYTFWRPHPLSLSLSLSLHISLSLSLSGNPQCHAPSRRFLLAQPPMQSCDFLITSRWTFLCFSLLLHTVCPQEANYVKQILTENSRFWTSTTRHPRLIKSEARRWEKMCLPFLDACEVLLGLRSADKLIEKLLSKQQKRVAASQPDVNSNKLAETQPDMLDLSPLIKRVRLQTFWVYGLFKMQHRCLILIGQPKHSAVSYFWILAITDV